MTRFSLLFSIVFFAWGGEVDANDLTDKTPVYYSGGKRGHIDGCRRVSAEAKAAGPNSTHGEMKAKDAMLCSRCPGSELNKQREAGADKKTELPAKNKPSADSKYGRKGAKARKAWLEIPEKHYDPGTKVYCDALWMRVHEESCPMLILKEMKNTMTLEQADKAGWRIGETGQSGRERCCFEGYRRKHSEKDIPEDAPGLVQTLKSGKLKWQLAGCHRFQVSSDQARMTMREAKEAGAFVCEHCIERGPSPTSISEEKFAKRPSAKTFVPPEGWEPKPFPTDKMPSKKEVDILIEETLPQGIAIMDDPFIDPVATLEQFMGMRFFFGYPRAYKVYRATGDKRLLDRLLESARHHHEICVKYPSVAQLKARDPEHMNYLFPMAAWSRITLQLARKYPESVTREEIAEAEVFLKALVSTLKPTCEGNDDLDPEMGIPRKLADDFRTRAFNRAMNGIGTIGMAAAALEDLQALKKTSEYQPTVDRYRKVVQEKIKHWKSVGCLFTEADGKEYFYYPYGAGDKGKVVDGFKLYSGPEDQGHFTYSVQGSLLVFDAAPELGIDDDFMTAIANAVYHNSLTKKHGSIQCPSADKMRPKSRKPYGAARTGFYALEAFKDGIVEGQCVTLNEEKKAQANSDYGRRVETVYGHYIKALRKDPTLIHLGEKK